MMVSVHSTQPWKLISIGSKVHQKQLMDFVVLPLDAANISISCTDIKFRCRLNVVWARVKKIAQFQPDLAAANFFSFKK
jgi:hypothetical protein